MVTFGTREEQKNVYLTFLLVALLTLLDGFFTWLSVDVLGIAQEGNQGLMALTGTLDFSQIMVARVGWGVGLAALLTLMALAYSDFEKRRFAYRGLQLVAGVFLLLLLWHLGVFALGFLGA